MALRTVLFVDDDIENMADHVRKLEDAGYAVTQRRTTDQALQEFMSDRAGGYDMIILDMMMPPPDREELSQYRNEIYSLVDVWDGLRSGGHLLSVLREKNPEPRPPVLLLSNLDESELLLEAWEQFIVWCTRHGKTVPSAQSEAAMLTVLRDQFATSIRGKRRTPPWHLPEVVQTLVGT